MSTQLSHHTRPSSFARAVALLAATGLALSGSACGGPSGPPPTVTPDATKIASQVLRIYSYPTPPVSQVLDIAIKNFNAQYPDWQIKIEPMRGDPTQDLAGPNPPDIIWSIDSLTGALVKSGVLLDMREIVNIDKAFKLDDISPDALAAGSIDNDPGLYMLPVSLETVILFYNKNLFGDSGAPAPTANWTWDDLIASCKQIQDRHPDVKCLSFNSARLPGMEWWPYWVPWVRGYGGDVLSKDGRTSTLSTPESLAGLQAYLDLWTHHEVALLPDHAQGDCFFEQKCAAVPLVSGVVNGYKRTIGDRFDWDVQLMPAYPQGQFSGTNLYGFGISTSSKNREMAWQFIKTLVSLDTQRAMAAQRVGVPLLKSLAGETAGGMAAPPANVDALFNASKTGIRPRSYPAACGNFYMGMVQSVTAQALQNALKGTIKIEDAFKAADAQIQACLDANK
jgi:multiple sugar transport system substrate-binding protein